MLPEVISTLSDYIATLGLDVFKEKFQKPLDEKKLKKEGVHYGGTADAKNQYLRPEKRSKSSSGKASEDEGDGDQPDSGGGS